MALNSSSSRLAATSTDQAVLRRFLFADEVKRVTALLAAAFVGQHVKMSAEPTDTRASAQWVCLTLLQLVLVL